MKILSTNDGLEIRSYEDGDVRISGNSGTTKKIGELIRLLGIDLPPPGGSNYNDSIHIETFSRDLIWFSCNEEELELLISLYNDLI